MGEMKPTPGPWKVSQNVSRHVVGPTGGVIASAELSCKQEISEANARLIAEAGTVFHNTGLSPVQLVEMVENLKELAADFMDAQADLDNREYMGIHAKPYEVLIRRRNLARDDLDAALAKCEGVGNDR